MCEVAFTTAIQRGRGRQLLRHRRAPCRNAPIASVAGPVAGRRSAPSPRARDTHPAVRSAAEAGPARGGAEGSAYQNGKTSGGRIDRGRVRGGPAAPVTPRPTSAGPSPRTSSHTRSDTAGRFTGPLGAKPGQAGGAGRGRRDRTGVTRRRVRCRAPRAVVAAASHGDRLRQLCPVALELSNGVRRWPGTPHSQMHDCYSCRRLTAPAMSCFNASRFTSANRLTYKHPLARLYLPKSPNSLGSASSPATP